MSRPTMDMLVISHGRPKEVARAVASAQGQGLDRILVLDNGTEPPLGPIEGAELIRSDENLGVAGGRNRILPESTADLFLAIDDDVTLQPGAVDAVREAFAADPGVFAVALRVEREDGTLLPYEQVFRLGMDIPTEKAPCTYFVGIGFAVRRQVLVDLGGFDDRMLWGSEELEVAFKALRAGWRMVYEPRAVCIHRPATAGRLPSGDRAAVHLANRVQLARTYLPLPAAVPHVLAWSALMGRDAVRAKDPGAVVRGLRMGFGRAVDRDPLPMRRLMAAHRIGGRVFF